MVEVTRATKALCPLGKYFKKLSKGKLKTKMTMEQTLDCMYDVQEKKCIADDTDIRNGTKTESMHDFLGDYFLHAYGLQKLATEKLDNFMGGLFKFEHVNERIRWFLVTLGQRKELLFSRLVRPLRLWIYDPWGDSSVGFIPVFIPL